MRFEIEVKKLRLKVEVKIRQKNRVNRSLRNRDLNVRGGGKNAVPTLLAENTLKSIL